VPAPGHRVRRVAGAAVAAALAVGGKLLGLALLPTLARRLGVRALALFGIVLLLLYLPYAEAGRALLAGLSVYARTWSFNGALFDALAALSGGPDGARVVAAVTVALAAIFAWARNLRAETTFLGLTGLAIALSPVVHPWYVTWLLPFAALARVRWPFVLAATVLIAYEVLDGYGARGAWAPAPWAPWAVYVPTAAALAWEAREAWRRSRIPGATESAPT
jgi:hypothetical protein